jgi:hypothetical protein
MPSAPSGQSTLTNINPSGTGGVLNGPARSNFLFGNSVRPPANTSPTPPVAGKAFLDISTLLKYNPPKLNTNTQSTNISPVSAESKLAFQKLLEGITKGPATPSTNGISSGVAGLYRPPANSAISWSNMSLGETTHNSMAQIHEAMAKRHLQNRNHIMMKKTTQSNHNLNAQGQYSSN